MAHGTHPVDTLPHPPPPFQAATGERSGRQPRAVAGRAQGGSQGAPCLCPSRVTTGRQPQGRAGSYQLAPQRAESWSKTPFRYSLHSTKPGGLTPTARGWSWSISRGAGQPEGYRLKHRQQVSALKTNHILFPRNKLSERIANTLTIQSTQV